MRAVLCALFVLSSFAVAEAQSGAPIHHAGRVIKRKALKVRHSYRATKRYVGHKYRGVKKAIKD